MKKMSNTKLGVGATVTDKEKNTSAYYYARDVENFMTNVTDASIVSKCTELRDRLHSIAKEMAGQAGQNTEKYRELKDSSSSIYDDFLNVMRDHHGSLE